MCVHIFTPPLDPEPKAAARAHAGELAGTGTQLPLPVLLLEPQPSLEAACRGVSSLNPSGLLLYSLSLAGPSPLDLLLGLILPTCQT